MRRYFLLILVFTSPMISFSQGVGINTTTPKSMLDVEGNVAIGATYSGTTAAPANGMIVEGEVGVGTSSPAGSFHVYGNDGDTRMRVHDAGANGIALTEYLNDVRNWNAGVRGDVSDGFAIRDVTAAEYRMIITTGGDVGIGTSSTTRKLHVYEGTAAGAWTYIESENADTRLALANNARVWAIYNNYTDDKFHIRDHTAGTNMVTVENTGEVGIGTTSPDRLLDIESTATPVFMQSHTTAANGEAGVEFLNDVQRWQAKVDASDRFQINDFTNNNQPFYIEAGSADNSIYIESTGDVGIGTSAPEAKLDIIDGSADAGPWVRIKGGGTVLENTGMRFYDNGTADANIINVEFAYRNVATETVASRIRSISEGANMSNGADIVLETTTDNSGTWNNNQLYLNDDGNVGIGTSAPASDLHVVGGGVRFERSSESIYFNPNYLGSGSFAMISTGIAASTSTMDLRLQAGTDDSSGGIQIKSDGKVGIARTPTTYAFEVNGDASKSSSGSWQANSDRRLKKDIASIKSEFALEKILQMRGVNYLWNDTVTGFAGSRPKDIQYGFIAQEVQEVLPDFVSKDGEGYLQMAYGTFDPLIIEAIKAQQLTIEELKKEVEYLKNMLKQ